MSPEAIAYLPGALEYLAFAMSGMLVFSVFMGGIVAYVHAPSSRTGCLLMATTTTVWSWLLWYLSPMVPGGTPFQRHIFGVVAVLLAVAVMGMILNAFYGRTMRHIDAQPLV